MREAFVSRQTSGCRKIDNLRAQESETAASASLGKFFWRGCRLGSGAANRRRFLSSNFVLGIVLGLIFVLFVPAAFAQTYPSEVKITEIKIGLPPSPIAPKFFEDPIPVLESFGRRAMSFFGVETFARQIQNIDFYGLFMKGRRLAAEKIPEYRSEIRKLCPAACNLPEIFRSLWVRVRSWLGR
jgi:hypothetical protein